MRKNVLIAVIVFALCGYSLVSKANAHDQDTAIKTIAILPFSVSIDTTNLPNGVTEDGLIRAGQIDRHRFQQALFIWFIKKPKRYSVSFQEIMTTNDLLKQTGLMDSADMQKPQLCAALGVDAVITGNVKMIKHSQTLGSSVTKGFIGVPLSSDNKIQMELNLYDASGNILWKRTYTDRGDVSPDELIDRLLKRAYETFPYKK